MRVLKHVLEQTRIVAIRELRGVKIVPGKRPNVSLAGSRDGKPFLDVAGDAVQMELPAIHVNNNRFRFWSANGGENKVRAGVDVDTEPGAHIYLRFNGPTGSIRPKSHLEAYGSIRQNVSFHQPIVS